MKKVACFKDNTEEMSLLANLIVNNKVNPSDVVEANYNGKEVMLFPSTMSEVKEAKKVVSNTMQTKVNFNLKTR